ncbi:hypothetical protein OAJ27_00955 [bacterium]|nr:hypothetical protein [bacterium]
MSESLDLAVFQLDNGPDITANKKNIASLLASTDTTETDLWVFPECALFRNRMQDDFKAFSATDSIIPWFQDLAIQHDKWIVVGSYFRLDVHKAKPFNTCVVIDPTGKRVCMYDKIHLFDVNLPTTTFSESDSFSSGTQPVTVDIKGFKIGLSICFDLRFPELYRHYADCGCDGVLIPSSFTQQTGKRHWHALCQARAIENQYYVIAPNQCGIGANQADTYGHSLVVDPFGSILCEGSEDKHEILQCTISKTIIKRTRQQFPLLNARKLKL